MMPAAVAARNVGFRPPGEAVGQLAEARATGALHSRAGTVYLAEGAVVHAESDRATNLATVLTASGRISAETWQETVRTFGPEHRVGSVLVARGRLTRGELELCHLNALYDAAFFALVELSAASWFEPGVQHWLGPVSPVSARRLRQETARRWDLLERIWPWPQVDTAPVAPVAATRPGPRTSPRQRELLERADGRRTPAELARSLGRSAFAVTVDVRRLAAAGLVATPPDSPAEPGEPIRTRSGLPQRRSRRPSHAAVPKRSALDPDVALLTRVLTALEARL